MILCPECGELASFNSWFGAYFCSGYTWEDDSYNIARIKKMGIRNQISRGAKIVAEMEDKLKGCKKITLPYDGIIHDVLEACSKQIQEEWDSNKDGF